MENLNPNVSLPKPSNSPSTKSSSKSQKTVSKNPVVVMRQRKFVKVTKNNPCIAYENLRAPQEEFFKNRSDENEEEEAESVGIEGENNNNNNNDEEEEEELEGISTSGVVKRRRERVLEEARNSVPENGDGRVMHLVKAFEKILTIPNSKKKEDDNDNNEKKKVKKLMKWALPGLQNLQQKSETDEVISASASDATNSSSLFSASDLVLTSQNLGLDQRVSVSSSWDSSRARKMRPMQGQLRLPCGCVQDHNVVAACVVEDRNLILCCTVSRTSSGGRRSRRNSLESSGTLGGRRWKKKQQQLKVTSQKPFKLRTEQRGNMKEEEFMNKIQQMMFEEEKLRIPIAQGLPWTTDEPECLVKPPVKESTKPIDLKLHSDVRAIDRAEFDHQVAEKMSLMEQYRLERERQQKLAEEEEIRRLRKELVPKAQPMPYFDRPFVPRRSMKHPTVPKEPRFHIPQHKKIKCCLSWNDMNPYSSYLN